MAEPTYRRPLIIQDSGQFAEIADGEYLNPWVVVDPNFKVDGGTYNGIVGDENDTPTFPIGLQPLGSEVYGGGF